MLDSDALAQSFELAGTLGGSVHLLPDGMDPAEYFKEVE